MRKLAVIKQERAAKIKAQTDLRDKATAEKRDKLTDDETTQFRALQGEIDVLTDEIADVEAYENNIRMMAGAAPSAMGGTNPEEREFGEMSKRFSLHAGLRAFQEERALTGVEKEVHDEMVKRAAQSGIQIRGLAVPTAIEKRFAGQSVTQDSGEYGAALVGTDRKELVDFLRPKPVLESLGAKYLTGLVGDVEFPVNEGGITATWKGEVASGDTSKNKYSEKTMKPKRLVSVVPISIQNLLQSSIDLEAYTKREIESVQANALDIAGINGTGTSGQPLGLLNDTGVPVIAIGTNGGAITWANIVGMETNVFIENANAAKMAYLINPTTKGKLKTTKHDAGDLNYLMAADNTINGYNVGVSNLVPGNITKGSGTNLSAAVFGDFSQLLIGQWGFTDLVLDKSTAADGYYRIIVNGFYDVLVRQPKAFVAIKDIANA
jgi:HK97 family phage major capsid protein